MTTQKKILFALPLILQFLCIALIEWTLLSNLAPHDDFVKTLMNFDQATLLQLGGILLVSVVLAMATMIADIVYLMQSTRFSSAQRTTWLVVLLLTGMVGQLIFFWKFIRKAPASKLAGK
jgi:hypothetical protein